MDAPGPKPSAALLPQGVIHQGEGIKRTFQLHYNTISGVIAELSQGNARPSSICAQADNDRHRARRYYAVFRDDHVDIFCGREIIH